MRPGVVEGIAAVLVLVVIAARNNDRVGTGVRSPVDTAHPRTVGSVAQRTDLVGPPLTDLEPIMTPNIGRTPREAGLDLVDATAVLVLAVQDAAHEVVAVLTGGLRDLDSSRASGVLTVGIGCFFVRGFEVLDRENRSHVVVSAHPAIAKFASGLGNIIAKVDGFGESLQIAEVSKLDDVVGTLAYAWMEG